MGNHLALVGFIRRRLLAWFPRNGRTYPWRTTRNPWRILIAEMMLQRTKADQVEGVYRGFFKRFKTAHDVATAKPAVLRRILVPLGLRWRIRNFRQIAWAILKTYNGKVPDTREQLLTLPGVGHYVAGAVLSVGFGHQEWIVDVNVVRVFRRFLGIKTSKEGRRDRKVIALAEGYSRTKKPREANLALLDFAALICLPHNPRCSVCPINSKCDFFSRMPNPTTSPSASG